MPPKKTLSWRIKKAASYFPLLVFMVNLENPSYPWVRNATIGGFEQMPLAVAVILVLIEAAAVALVVFILCVILVADHFAILKKAAGIVGASILLVGAIAAVLGAIYKSRNR